MKKYKLYLTMAASLFLASSCYDLDVYPEDKLPVDTFFQTQDQVDQAMMGVYNQLQNENVFGRQPGFDCLGFVGSGYDPASYQQIGLGTYTTDNSLVTGKFKQLYEGVARANLVLQNVDKCAMSDELKAQYKGEARFLRGLYYFTLLDFFGGVPLYDETTDYGKEFMTMLKGKSSVEDTRKFIMDDLTEAERTLPTAWSASNHGRATKAAAQALMGKVLLYKASATKQQADYQAAKDYFEALVTNTERYGTMELYPDYAKLFTPEGDESSEMIFAIQNMGGVGKDFGMPLAKYLGSRATFGSDWNNVMASVKFVDSYECKNGKKFDWDDVFPGYNDNISVRKKALMATLTKEGKVATYPEGREKLLEMYENRDPRMKATIILPYTHYAGWYQNAPLDTELVLLEKQGEAHEKNGLIRINQGHHYYLWRKFVPEGDMNGELNNREHTPINFPLIRLADVYLMLAECWNELPGGQSKAVEYINKVRARQSVNMPAINSGEEWLKADTKEEVFDRIRHERQVELAAEGWNFSDMRRWGVLEEVKGDVLDIFGKKKMTRSVIDRDYLWPFPASEIEMNPTLKGQQNPGW